MARKFYKNVIVVEVLTEDAPLPDGFSLHEIAYQISEGDWSGDIRYEKPQELTPKQAAEALIAQGSDPEFFMLDEDGNEVDEVDDEDEEDDFTEEE